MDVMVFESREDFRFWLKENCRAHGGVWLLFGKPGRLMADFGREKRLQWLIDRLNRNMKPMEKG